MSDHYLGLISGTSMDGIDAAIVDQDSTQIRLVKTLARPYGAQLRADLFELIDAGSKPSLDTLCQLDVRLGRAFAEAANTLLESCGMVAGDIVAIGSHGQTVRHVPTGPAPFSLQIGNPNVIAADTGIPVVADFRGADIALGGQGAPLTPAFHGAAFSNSAESRAVVNLGGIANVTLLPGHGAATGFDTGPANALLDGWCERHRGEMFDGDGGWARSGSVVAALLKRMLADEYFSRPPPKSTGREHFHLAWLDAHIATQPSAPDPADVQATLIELSARTIIDALRENCGGLDRILLCGGGSHNAFMVQRLQEMAGVVPVESTAEHGVDPDWVEAVAFAWLAWRTLRGMPGNLPTVTGAISPAVLGGVFAPQPNRRRSKDKRPD